MIKQQIYNNMKKLFLILTLFLALTVTGSAYAQGLLQTKTGTNAAARNSLAIQSQTDRLTNLKQRADTEIKRRIDALNNLLTKVGTLKKLTPVELAGFQSQIQAQITELNTLKTKIDADTDLTTLKTDVAAIVTNYRIFAFFIVDINLTVTVDKMTSTVADMTIIYGKLQKRSQEAQSKGADVTALNALLTDMNTNLNNAKTTLTTVQSELAGLNVAGYPGNKSILMDSRTKLKTAYSYLKTAHKDAMQIRGGLVDDKSSFKLKSNSNSTASGFPIEANSK